jgi:hypothetical protein
VLVKYNGRNAVRYLTDGRNYKDKIRGNKVVTKIILRKCSLHRKPNTIKTWKK